MLDAPQVPAPVPMRRRALIAVGGLLLALGALPVAQAQQAPESSPPLPQGDITVTLLGTGTPDPNPLRFSAATLVEAGGMRFLFDAGRGATIRLNQLRVPLGSLEAVLLTHLHSDHVVGLPDLWLMGFINPYFGGRRTPLRVLGPKGTQNLVQHIEKAYEADVAIRIADQGVAPEATRITAEEFLRGGVVFDKGGVRITAFEVDHGDLVKPAFGFRIDYNGRSLGISGDTRYDEGLIKQLTGVDLLIHSVADVPDDLQQTPWVKDIMAHHTSAAEGGAVFAKTRPKLAVFTHLVFLGTPDRPRPTPADIVRKARTTYSGPLVVGSDLMRFVVADQVRGYGWDTASSQYVPLPAN